MIKILLILSVLLFPSLNVRAFENISAKAYVLMEQSTGTVILEKNSKVKMKPASTTKILTAVCAIENAMLSDKVTVSKNAAYQEGSSVYLKPGDEMTMENMIYGLMLSSGNDAAVAIAEHIAGDTEKFSNVMNNKARDIGAMDSNFENPNGLDDDKHYVTAYDLALITAYALKNDFFLKTVSLKSKVISDLKGTKRYLSNHNKMLHNYEGCIGVKTGFTKKSGRTLVTAAERNGIRLVAVTLNAPNDWDDHEKLLNKGFDTVRKQKVLNDDEVVDNVEVRKGKNEYLPVKCEKEYYGIEISGKETDYDVLYKYDKLKAPVKKGEKAGEAIVFKNGKEVFRTKLITCHGTERKKGFSIIEFIKRIFGYVKTSEIYK